MGTVQGYVVNVMVEDSAGEVLSDALVGATTIQLADAYSFNEGGGSFIVDEGDTPIGYTSADLEADTLTLAVPLAELIPAETILYVNPRGQQKVAMVEMDDDDEGIRALVPFTMADRFIEGIRDPDEYESVLVSDESGRWEISAVDEQIPKSDGAYIDPGTLPPDEGPTTPPAASPVPIVLAGSGAAVVKWSAVALATEYDLHVATTDVNPPSNLTLHTVNAHSPTWVSETSDSVPATPDRDLYFALVARNSIDAAAPSAWVVGRGGPINEEIMAASLAIVKQVIAEIVETQGLQIGDHTWNETTGLTIPDVLNFPPNDATQAEIWAKLIARSLTVENNFELRGLINSIQMGAKLILDEGVTPPRTGPTIGSTWPTDLVINDEKRGYAECRGVANIEAYPDRTLVLRKFTSNDSWLFPADKDTPTSENPGVWTGLMPYGLAHHPDSNHYFVLGKKATTNEWWIHAYTLDATTSAPTKVGERLVGASSTFSQDPTIVATEPLVDNAVERMLVIGTRSDNTLKATRFTFNWATNAWGTAAAVNVGSGAQLGHLGAAIFCTGPGQLYGDRYILFPKSGDARTYQYDYTTGASSSSNQVTFPRAYGSTVVGACLKPGTTIELQFCTVDPLYVRSEYAADLFSTIYYGYTWYDGDGTTHETSISPLTIALPYVVKGAFPLLTFPPPPDDGTAESPDRIRVYAKNGSGGTLKLQDTLAPGATTYTQPYYNDASATTPPAPPGTFGTVGSDPAQVASSAADGDGPIIELNGDGSGRVGPYKWTAAGADADDTGWIDMTLGNSWVNYDAAGTGFSQAAYRRIGKTVHLKGLIKNGTDATAITTLPAGFRPTETRMFTGISAIVNETSGAASAGTAHTHPLPINTIGIRIDVDAAGVISKRNAAGSNAYVSLDGIQFLVD